MENEFGFYQMLVQNGPKTSFSLEASMPMEAGANAKAIPNSRNLVAR
jgi:hypothetical protein